MIEIATALAGVGVAGNMLGRILKGSPPAAPQAAPPPPAQSEIPPSLSGDAAVRLRQIAANYDLEDISPGGLSSLLQELHQAGLLDDPQYHELSLIRLDLDAAGVEPDETIDLLEFYAEKLEEAAEAAAGMAAADALATIEPYRRRHAWLQKLALLQSAPDGGGLDAMA